MAQGEFVAEMVLVLEDGKYLVDHAMVFEQPCRPVSLYIFVI